MLCKMTYWKVKDGCDHALLTTVLEFSWQSSQFLPLKGNRPQKSNLKSSQYVYKADCASTQSRRDYVHIAPVKSEGYKCRYDKIAKLICTWHCRGTWCSQTAELVWLLIVLCLHHLITFLNALIISKSYDLLILCSGKSFADCIESWARMSYFEVFLRGN